MKPMTDERAIGQAESLELLSRGPQRSFERESLQRLLARFSKVPEHFSDAEYADDEVRISMPSSRSVSPNVNRLTPV
jgi:hypothetical protein